jgi:purine nucleoside phosphorylase
MPRIAVICGTGMSAFASTLASGDDPRSNSMIVESQWGNVPLSVVNHDLGVVFVIDRHHSTENARTPPHAIEHRANVHAAASCEPDLLVSVNSVGSMLESMPPGTVGVAEGVLDLSIKPWTFHDDDAIHADRTSPFDPKASSVCEEVLAEKQGSPPSRVVVAQCVGPQFESPSEIDALEMLGANVVGMTLGPEQRLVSETGIAHISLLCSSNWAAGRTPGDPDAQIDHGEVDEMASEMRDLVASCILSLLENLHLE